MDFEISRDLIEKANEKGLKVESYPYEAESRNIEGLYFFDREGLCAYLSVNRENPRLQNLRRKSLSQSVITFVNDLGFSYEII